MLLRGSNTRGARGQSANRSRGSRGGRGSSRGASPSSSKWKSNSAIPTEPKALRDRSNEYFESRGSFCGRHPPSFYNNQYSKKATGPSSSVNHPNKFEQERLENAAKREQRGRGHNGVIANGRGNHPRGSKQVRFSNPAMQDESTPTGRSSSPSTSNPFKPDKPSTFSTHSSVPISNSFAAQLPTTDPFSNSSASNPFSSQTQAPASSNPFARPFPQSSSSTTTASVFGAPSTISSNPFVAAQDKANSSVGSSFGAPSGLFGLGSTIPTASTFKVENNDLLPALAPAKKLEIPQNTSPADSSASSIGMGNKITQLLQNEGIYAPSWPTSTPGDPKQKSAIEAFWQTSKKYRNRVRSSLIHAGFLDDPDKPKKLSEAIDFKGTCEEMCPEFEKITRIMEHDVREPEKDVGADGTLWPSPQKMIKALARSAAGQDAPLPMDVRSPAALRRTLDYLLHTVLGDEEGRLPNVHGFLWDRTRAIRRDFVFQSSMSSTELLDQVYCLERITRFHVIALHQMSMVDIEADDFSEQQEIEQLGKSLLSLIHAYEDCQAQGVVCENEPEFRAYYVLFNSHNTGILETVQDWGWRFWGGSEEIKIAVSLVETLQNTWDTRGPLNPHSATDIAQNAFSRFFSIVEDKSVSYPMACFAEIHFNNVRKSALKAIFATYRLQKPRTRDWTLEKLNAYLRFDAESDIVPFAEAYGLRFEDNDGQEYLSFESDETISDPFPPLKQRHSYSLVERKRGNYSLPEVIDNTVWDEGQVEEALENEPAEGVDDSEGLFVQDGSAQFNQATTAFQPQAPVNNKIDTSEQPTMNGSQPATAPESISKPISIFEQVSTSKPLPVNSFTLESANKPASDQINKGSQSSSFTSMRPEVNATPSILSIPPTKINGQPPSHFGFLQQPLMAPTQSSLIPSASGSLSATSVPKESSKPIFSLGSSATPPITVPPFNGSTFPSFNLGSYSTAAPTTSESPKQQSPLGDHSDKSSSQPFLSNTTAMKDSPFRLPKDKAPLSLAPLPPVTGTTQEVTPGSYTQNSSHIPSGLASQTTSMPLTKPNAALEHNSRLQRFSNWIAAGDGGIIDQFTEYAVGELLSNAMEIYEEEEALRIATEAEETARKQADEARYRYLATKYSRKWRTLAYQIWLKRKGKQARNARKDLANSLRASKATQAANIVEDFKASTTKIRRPSLESLLDSTGALDGVHNSSEKIGAIVHDGPRKSSRKQQMSKASPVSAGSTASTHKRGKSDNPFRRSILSDPSYLTGGSRIHLLSNYSAKDETRRRVSGVQTDYFRLKARGITTLPDGTPLASTVANQILRQKRSFDGAAKAPTPAPTGTQETPRSVSNHNDRRREGPRSSVERDEEIQALKSRAKAVMAQDETTSRNNPKRSFEADDEELFERAKRVREQMDEGAGWYREQVERHSASRSFS